MINEIYLVRDHEDHYACINLSTALQKIKQLLSIKFELVDKREVQEGYDDLHVNNLFVALESIDVKPLNNFTTRQLQDFLDNTKSSLAVCSSLLMFSNYYHRFEITLEKLNLISEV